MDYSDILVSVINHNRNQNAIALKNGFKSICQTILIDSGSLLKPDEYDEFDFRLPNVYYSGLLNQAHECLIQSPCKVLLIIASDVQVADYQILIDRVLYSFHHFKTGVYAPSALHSHHRKMLPDGSKTIKKIAFTDGFCFAVDRMLLDVMCPIDTNINYLGQGLDIYLGFLALKYKKNCFVDHGVVVKHPLKSGYNEHDAKYQMELWIKTLSSKAQKFYHLVWYERLRNRFGYWIIKILTREKL